MSHLCFHVDYGDVVLHALFWEIEVATDVAWLAQRCVSILQVLPQVSRVAVDPVGTDGASKFFPTRKLGRNRTGLVTDSIFLSFCFYGSKIIDLLGEWWAIYRVLTGEDLQMSPPAIELASWSDGLFERQRAPFLYCFLANSITSKAENCQEIDRCFFDTSEKIVKAKLKLWWPYLGQGVGCLAYPAHRLVVVELWLCVEWVEAAVAARVLDGPVVTLLQMAEMVVPVGEGHGAEGTLGVFMEGTLFVVVLLQCMNVGKLKENKMLHCLLRNRISPQQGLA